MNDTERDKARALTDKWAADNNVHSVLANHHNDLDDRIATALAERDAKARRETWEAAIEAIAPASQAIAYRYFDEPFDGDPQTLINVVSTEMNAALEAAKEKDEQR